MGKIAILFGLLLIGLGVAGYAGAGSSATEPAEATAAENAEETGSVKPAKKSVTALIPAFFGIGLVICGLLAFKQALLKHAMHAAAMIGLLGTIAGAGRGAMGLGKFFAGDPSLNQRSFLFVWLMALLCGIFVILCIRSFIAARKQKQAEQAT